MLFFKGFGVFSHVTGFKKKIKKKVRLYALILAVSHTVPEFFWNYFCYEKANHIFLLLSHYMRKNGLRCGEKENGESFSTFSVSVPRPGIEPGWVAPLVFETSASTDSAIWAIA